MNHAVRKSLAAIGLVGASLVGMGAAQAGGVNWHIGINLPGPAVIYEPPVVYAPPPHVVYAPPPPVVYRPAPIYYQPAPVYAYPRHHWRDHRYRGHRHHHHHYHHDDDRRGHRGHRGDWDGRGYRY